MLRLIPPKALIGSQYQFVLARELDLPTILMLVFQVGVLASAMVPSSTLSTGWPFPPLGVPVGLGVN